MRPDTPRTARRMTARDITLDARDLLMRAMADAVTAARDGDDPAHPRVAEAMAAEAVKVATRWDYVSWPGLFGEG